MSREDRRHQCHSLPHRRIQARHGRFDRTRAEAPRAAERVRCRGPPFLHVALRAEPQQVHCQHIQDLWDQVWNTLRPRSTSSSETASSPLLKRTARSLAALRHAICAESQPHSMTASQGRFRLGVALLVLTPRHRPQHPLLKLLTLYPPPCLDTSRESVRRSSTRHPGAIGSL